MYRKATTNRSAFLALGLLLAVSAPARGQEMVFHCDTAHTKATFNLSATMHTVHGIFLARRCELRFDPATGKLSGAIVFDANTGNTGNDGRDAKMHKDVLQSDRFPDLTFHPDHVEGKVSDSGSSTVQVHGMFGVHGGEHELTVPVVVIREGERWTATTQFPVPYVAWGMKNPSNVFLHVGDSVEAQFHGMGTVETAPAAPPPPNPQ
jgi:polyisoprenoid-binding protein YceI